MEVSYLFQSSTNPARLAIAIVRIAHVGFDSRYPVVNQVIGYAATIKAAQRLAQCLT